MAGSWMQLFLFFSCWGARNWNPDPQTAPNLKQNFLGEVESSQIRRIVNVTLHKAFSMCGLYMSVYDSWMETIDYTVKFYLTSLLSCDETDWTLNWDGTPYGRNIQW